MSFNFMAAVIIYSDFGAQKIMSATVSTVSPSICHEITGPDAMTSINSFPPAFWIRNSASELKSKVCAMALSLYVSSFYCSQKIPDLPSVSFTVIPDFLPLYPEGVLSQLITFVLMDSVILPSQCSQSFG